MVKRILSLAAAALLALSLCACGGDAGSSSSAVASPSPKASATPKPTATPEPASQEESTETYVQEPQYTEPEVQEPVAEEPTYTEPEVQDPVVEEPSYTEPEVPVAEPTPEPVQEASPYDYVGYDLGTFCSVFGYPGDSAYGPSCMGDGEDGILYYDGFTVYTFRSSDGSETVTSVA